MALTDAICFALAVFGAFLLRFDFLLSARHLHEMMLIVYWLIPLKLSIFFAFGLYKEIWRYSSLRDLWFLTLAVSLSSLLTLDIVLYLNPFEGFSRAVVLLDAIITLLMTGGLRIFIRTLYQLTSSSTGPSTKRLASRIKNQASKRVLIIGAGDSGAKILREILDSPTIDYEVVGFLDDDAAKKGRAIHGIPVLGTVDDLPNFVDQHKLDQVIISTSSATGPKMRRIVAICKSCGISFKTLPVLGEILNDKVSIKSLRDVNYEDLLGRPSVHLDMTGIQSYLSNQKVMVTGAGGSIGSELCRQLVRFAPEKVLLVDVSEANLYQIQMELRHELNFNAVHPILASIQNQRLMEDVFRTYRPDVVFHAAAYKHVPLLETTPWEAVSNNVIGSQVVMTISEKFGVKRFVLVSTDKAVCPASVMGTSKRLAELILQSVQNGVTRYMAVRFGNVIASSGSVIPLFRKQIEHGGPVTVTHPEVTRYFMTITEAAQLILQAGAMGEGGEVFVLEMGTPLKIADIAVDLIRLSGKEPGKDIDVVYTGLRPGEKLSEELTTGKEDVTCTNHEKIMVIKHNGNWTWFGFNDQDRFRNWLDREIRELCKVAESHDPLAIKEKLKQLVPEYTPQKTACVL